MCSEKEEKMNSMDHNAYGLLIYPDDMSSEIDALLSGDSVRERYHKSHDRSWITLVQDPGLQYGLRLLSETQQRIIEKLMLGDGNVLDVRRELGMSARETRIQIRNIRRVLLRYM